MTCRELPGAGLGPTPDNMNKCLHTELSSHEGTRSEFNPGKAVIKLGIDVHQEHYVVVVQEGGGNPKPAQRFKKEAFLCWAAKLKQKSGAEMHAVYEACGFGFGLQRQLAALGIACHVVCPQKLDEHNKRVKTDGLDAKALCLKLDRFVEGNREALAVVRVPTEEEEQLRAIHRQREQLVKTRKRLEAQGRSLMVNHGVEPVQRWWKRRTLRRCGAGVDERRSHQQPADPAGAGGKDPRLDRATPGCRLSSPTTRTGADDQWEARWGQSHLLHSFHGWEQSEAQLRSPCPNHRCWIPLCGNCVKRRL